MIPIKLSILKLVKERKQPMELQNAKQDLQFILSFFSEAFQDLHPRFFHPL